MLASFLTHIEDQKLQSEAANALANISAGSADNTRAVIDAGVVPIATLLLVFKAFLSLHVIPFIGYVLVFCSVAISQKVTLASCISVC